LLLLKKMNQREDYIVQKQQQISDNKTNDEPLFDSVWLDDVNFKLSAYPWRFIFQLAFIEYRNVIIHDRY